MQLSETLPSHNIWCASTLSPGPRICTNMQHFHHLNIWNTFRNARERGRGEAKESVLHNSRVQKMLITSEVICHTSFAPPRLLLSRFVCACLVSFPLISCSRSRSRSRSRTCPCTDSLYIFNQCHSNWQLDRFYCLLVSLPHRSPLAFFNCMEFH